MRARDSVRFRRQLGFVHQGRLAAARLLVAGRGPVLPYLLQNLALLGFGKGPGELRVHAGGPLEPADLAAQFLWSGADLGLDPGEAAAAALEATAGDLTLTSGGAAPAPRHGFDLAFELADGALGPGPHPFPVVRGALTPLGFWAGAGAWPAGHAPPAPGLYTAALAATCGALLAQEALRALALLRPVPIDRVGLALELALPAAADGAAIHARFDGIARGAGLQVAEQDAPGGGVALRVVLPPDLDVTWELLERLHVGLGAYPEDLARPRPLAWFTPFERLAPAREAEAAASAPAAVRGKRIALGGIGGLGSWIAPVLAVSGLEDCDVELVDRDEVEAHNLNRQVLYRESDVGRAKASAAAERAAELGPASRWLASPRELTLHRLAGADGARLASADLVVSAFDNAYARYLLGMWASERAVDHLDVGGGGLDGNVNLYRRGEHCILCHWGAKRSVEETRAFAHRREASRCQADDRGSPLVAGALVTTSAILAGAAAAIGLATLAGGPTPAHQLTYLARPNELRKCPLQERLGHRGCTHHRHGEDHERHAGGFREELEYLDQMVPEAGRVRA